MFMNFFMCGSLNGSGFMLPRSLGWSETKYFYKIFLKILQRHKVNSILIGKQYRQAILQFNGETARTLTD